MRQNTILILCTAFSLLTTACKSGESRQALPEPVPLVESYLCIEELSRHRINSFGTVTARQKADILPPASSVIRELRFEEGDRVHEGEIMAVLDIRQIDIQIKEARAAVKNRESALELSTRRLEEGRREMESRLLSIRKAEIEYTEKQAELERMEGILANRKSLYEVGGITREEFLSVELEFIEKESSCRQAECSLDSLSIGFRQEDLAAAGYSLVEDTALQREQYIELNTRVLRAELKMAESELEAARTGLESLELFREENRIRAPFSGTVVRRYQDVGETCSTERPIYHISDFDTLFLQVRMSSREMNLISRGGEAVVSLNRGRENEIIRKGEINRISPWIDKESGSGEVLILLDNRDRLFRLGDFLHVSLPWGEAEKRISVPGESLIENKVFLIRDNCIFSRKVETAEPDNGWIPVLSGLSPGDRIVRSPLSRFVDGMEVVLR